MNIVVLAGGYSSERDVSLTSGSRVCEALRKKGHRVLLLDPYFSIDFCDSFDALCAKYSKETYDFTVPEVEPDLAELKAAAGNGEALIGRNILEACRLADVVFMGLHGSVGENGQLQAAFNLFDIKYTGSGYVGSAISMDKTIAKEIMSAYGIKTPSGDEIFIGGKTPEEIYVGLAKRKLPFIMKPTNGGSSLGVTIVKNYEELIEAIRYAQKYEDKVLVESFISGREFTVGVLGGEALPVIEIRPHSGIFDYKHKYQAGITDEICPAPIPDELAERLKDMAVSAHNALRLGSYSRADFIVDENEEIYCLEVNSLPGLTPASLVPREAKVIGLSYEDLCDKIVSLAVN